MNAALTGNADESQTLGIIVADVVEAKRRQNLVFKRYGSAAWLFGVGGFLPTTILGVYHGVPWSASSMKPHPDVDLWLIVHAFSMWLWCLAVAVQFWTGGRPQKTSKLIHRYSGYMGFGALTSGMLCGGIVYTVKHDFCEHDQIAAGYYTVVISIFAWVNMAVAVDHARQHRTAEHKDFMLMALMWTMDPAVQRAAMHLLRLCLYRSDPATLLAVGKLCSNVFLTVVFGSAAIRARRENMCTVLNVGAEWAFGLMYASAILAGLMSADVFTRLDKRDLPLLYGVTASSGFILLVLGVASLWIRSGSLRLWRPTCLRRVLFIVWFLLVGGFELALFAPQGSSA
eukprot:TRINITY_DN74741_c0_g1_i1.p1 TRINITY_DN74741_c0_g1~~TRINITY_DN74741_c0_g1_i1.p1  ORF type:complete len:349 (-),score=29.86 TRINITY_DN74741_c0_g1_i1:231-1256(-)